MKNVFGKQTVVFFLPLIIIRLLGGVRAVWKWRPWVTSAFSVLSFWGGTMFIALLQRTASKKNASLALGAPAAVGIGVSMLDTSKLEEDHWINSDMFMRVSIAVGYLLGLLNEYFTVWSRPDHDPVRASDWWSNAFYGPMFYWGATYPLIGSAFVFFRKKKTLTFPLCLMFFAWWLVTLALQARWREEGKEFQEYGIRDVI